MLLSAIGHREIPIPEHIDIYHLTREMAPSDKTALQCVMEVDEERIHLEKEAERLASEDCECLASILRLLCPRRKTIAKSVSNGAIQIVPIQLNILYLAVVLVIAL